MKSRVSIECKQCKNTLCYILQCNAEYVNLISEKKIQIPVAKGQYIFREDSPVFGIYFIQQGKAKIVSSNFDGKEQIVRLAGNGHLLGHRGYGGETYPVGAVALEDSRVCFLDNDLLYEAFKANFEFLYSVMMFYSMELRKSEQRAKYFAQMTVEERVIFALLYIRETYSTEEQPDFRCITLARQEIADLAATNADQVSRVLASLKKMDLIGLEGRKIFLENVEGLKKSIARYTTAYF